jgi:hypothetical protein
MPRVVPSQIVGFIDEQFSFAGKRQAFNVDIQFKDRVSALLRLADELPDELMVMEATEYNRFVLCVSTMKSTIELEPWNSRGHMAQYYDQRLGEAISDLRACLEPLPDQQVPAATAGLPFINDDILRESIRRDIASAEQALRDAEWKGATVIGGAIIEALLLWAINERPQPDVQKVVASLKASRQLRGGLPSDPNDWTLETYKKVAVELRIITDDAAKLIEVTQSFRNLIHPGKAIRTRTECNRSTARTALAAVERIVGDFSP